MDNKKVLYRISYSFKVYVINYYNIVLELLNVDIGLVIMMFDDDLNDVYSNV